MFRRITVLVTITLVIGLSAAGSVAGSALGPPVPGDVPSAGENALAPVAEPASSDAPNAATVYYKTYSGNDFTARSSLVEFDYQSGGAIYATKLVGGASDKDSFVARLDLPNGARIVEVIFYVVDNTASNFIVAVTSYAPATKGFTNLLFDTPNLPANTSVQAITKAGNPITTVDNRNFNYVLRIQPQVTGTNHQIVGARVGYTVPTAYLPILLR